MAGLNGLSEYLKEWNHISIFDQALDSETLWEFHLHQCRIVRAKILTNPTYDLKLDIEGIGEEELPKTYVKFLYPVDKADSIKPLIKTDKKVKALGLEPLISPRDRFHIKNKTLFPLMQEKSVVFFTLLEGEIIRGIIAGFSQYDITINLKGGIPVTILRHSVYNLQDKKGRCYLKSIQEKQKDWKKSELYVST